MRHLIQWIDFRYIWGFSTGPFITRFFAGSFTLVMSWQIIAAAPARTVMQASESYPMMADALFRGVRPNQYVESFADARHCLAQAIYFEARSEPVTGWSAVADVVINRAQDPRYPGMICGVVFQGESRRHKCQFSFACDGLPERVKNRSLWQRALHIADTKLQNMKTTTLSDKTATAQATHYHADYVTPYWSRDMVRLTKIGRHIFYADQVSDRF